MAMCPKCHRNSLEYSYGRKVAWCLYIKDCNFEIEVEDHQVFHQEFEKVEHTQANTCEA